MKFTYEEKLKMYDLWKKHGWSPKKIAKVYHGTHESIRYMIFLMDRHGVETVKHGKNKYYSSEFKMNAIKRVLLDHESATEVSLNLGLKSCSTLLSWIKSYEENGYTIVEKRKGRKPHGKEESTEDPGGTGEGKRRTSPAEPETYSRELILKKIGCLSSGTRKPGKEEIARAITELRQELACSLKFILDTIQANSEMPQITRSDYYYQVTKIDKDMKNDAIMNQIIDIFYHHKCCYGLERSNTQS